MLYVCSIYEEIRLVRKLLMCQELEGRTHWWSLQASVEFIMGPEPEVSESGNKGLGTLKEDSDGTIPGRIDAFNGLAEGSYFSDVLQAKCGHYGDLPASKISELMKLGSLENTSTQSLFTVTNMILDECVEGKNENIPQRVASILNKAHCKSREERYQSKIRALETLATGTTEENEVVMNQLRQMKIEKTKMEEVLKLEQHDLTILRQEKDRCESLILSLEEEIRLTKQDYEEKCFQLEARAEETKDKLLKKILELERLLTDSRNKVKELEDFSESKFLRWKRKEHGYRHFIDSQFESLQDLRLASESIKQEVSKIKNVYAEEFYHFGVNIKGLIDAAQNYHSVLEENRKLYNEVQDLKGNIRVYCRIRPFLPGQSRKQTTIQYIGENGELVVINPLKPGKDSHRLFKFNKVFGPASTQEEVFRDTQPLIRSVLDGYNVCIFAYGQTGSGKTYTMTGPNATSVVDWGVNYRALNDLFNISQNRHSSIAYEPNGLAVPDASMHPVKSTSDVLELMSVGLMNRAVGATALNERSSRSHSILTVHVRGTDLETNAVLRGCLHLVDLAGSERVDRSEATGDRLREAQHINKSLSALGDVIFALAQKNPHVPYRNSKLTQVLQSSLGGQAKALMFVQLNPDVESYSETISTLKFAERVSGVELGAARSNKEGRGVRELMEQVATLKDAAAKKDEEIVRLRLLKTNGNYSIGVGRSSQQLSGVKSSDGKAAFDMDNSSEYSDKHSDAGSQQSVDDFRHQKEFFQQSKLAVVGGTENYLEDIESNLNLADGGKSPNGSIQFLESGDVDTDENLVICLTEFFLWEPRLILQSIVFLKVRSHLQIQLKSEHFLHFYSLTLLKGPICNRRNVPFELPRPPTKQGQAGSSRLSLSRSSTKVPSSKRATLGSSSAVKLPKNWH
ncbi:Kinesin-like protein KIN-14J [Sesamum angolense]|uniref:Kinesin-like protein KIN-14J n=1 Tax=Sesamum angolense TaxID=2727404 RepID=A0AAE2BWY9_9LAMI|nr:Kinesin-like protein KIN-14J [Sesamum angolense]